MTDTYNDTTGSRKKFLIPLVVLLLCAVSLTGAGYAYNSTVTVENNHVQDQDFVLTVKDKAGDDVTTPMTMDGLMVLQHATTVSANNAVIVSAEALPGYIGSILINDEVDANYTVTATIGDPVTKTLAVDGKEGSIAFDIKVGLFTDSTCQTPYTGNLSGDQTLYYKVYVEVSNTNAITFAGTADSQGCVDAVGTVLSNVTFNLSFSAQSAA